MGHSTSPFSSQHQPHRKKKNKRLPPKARTTEKGQKQTTDQHPRQQHPHHPKKYPNSSQKVENGGVWGLNPGPLTKMKYPEAGGTQSENHTTRPTPHHTEALEKHRTVGFSAAKAVQGRSWSGRILVWPRSWIVMGWLEVVWFLRWRWRVLLGWGVGIRCGRGGRRHLRFCGCCWEGTGHWGLRRPRARCNELWALGRSCSSRPAVAMPPPGNGCGSLSSGPRGMHLPDPGAKPGTRGAMFRFGSLVTGG